MFKVPEQFRITNSRNPSFNTTAKDGNNGMFSIRKKNPYANRDKLGRAKNKKDGLFMIIASDELGWEHVSVSLALSTATPTWEDMCYIKNLFWDKTDTVIQYHPAEEDYVNNHPGVLHLWRPTQESIPKPPPEFVGIKDLGTLIK